MVEVQSIRCVSDFPEILKILKTRGLKGPKNAVFVLGDLDLQTRPSEGPNKSSL